MDIRTGKALDLSGAILFSLAGIVFLYFGLGVFSLGCFFGAAAFVLSHFEWQRREDFWAEQMTDHSDRKLEIWTIILFALLAFWCFVVAIWNVLI